MNPTVLIVDDEPKVFQALRRALHREPYEVLTAGDADEAFEILEARGIDVVISDENMPGLTGTEFLGQVRQRWPQTTRMMLTGNARLDLTLHAINEAGIERFFTKPCDEAELIIAIRDAVEGCSSSQDDAPAEGATPAADDEVTLKIELDETVADATPDELLEELEDFDVDRLDPQS